MPINSLHSAQSSRLNDIDKANNTVSSLTLKQWLNEADFTLTMSSGFFGFFAHAGMLSALSSHGISPSKVTGSSAGALIAGCYASGLQAQEIKHALLEVTKNDFWDPSLGLGLLKGQLFRKKLTSMLACDRFEECRTPAAISVWQGVSRKVEVMTEGSLSDAIYASCAVPFLFQPIWMRKRPYWDGGIGDRPGLAGTYKDERVFYHHIASRSPWRQKNSPSMQLPRRADLASLAIEGLPRSGPNKLGLGRHIMQLAEEVTLIALEQPLVEWEDGHGYYQRMSVPL